MSDPSSHRGGRSPLAPWLPVLLLLAPAIVLPLVVPIYAREDPTFVGFPFYYWFQFLLIVVAVALTVPAFLLSKRVDRGERVRHGLPPEPPGDPDARPAARRTEGEGR